MQLIIANVNSYSTTLFLNEMVLSSDFGEIDLLYSKEALRPRLSMPPLAFFTVPFPVLVSLIISLSNVFLKFANVSILGPEILRP